MPTRRRLTSSSELKGHDHKRAGPALGEKSTGLVSFHGTAKGLPSVARFDGVSALGLAPARLYDRAGDVVGSENAQFLNNAPFIHGLQHAGGLHRGDVQLRDRARKHPNGLSTS
jgi:hypothetical protein